MRGQRQSHQEGSPGSAGPASWWMPGTRFTTPKVWGGPQTILWMAVFFHLTAAGEAATVSPWLLGDTPCFTSMQSQCGLPRQLSSLQGCSHHHRNTAKVSVPQQAKTAKVSVPRQAKTDPWIFFFWWRWWCLKPVAKPERCQGQCSAVCKKLEVQREPMKVLQHL